MAHTENSAATGAMPGAISDAFGLLARWNYSLTAFYLRRFQRQMELPMKLARTASPADLIELRRAFEADLVADYRDQAEALHHSCGDSNAGSSGPDGGYGAELLRAQEHASVLEQAKAQADRIIASAQARADEIMTAASPSRATPRRAAAG